MRYERAHEVGQARFCVEWEGSRCWRWEVSWTEVIEPYIHKRHLLARGWAPSEYLAAIDAEQAIFDLAEVEERRKSRLGDNLGRGAARPPT